MTKSRRKVTDEFKREAVALLQTSGRPLMPIADPFADHGDAAAHSSPPPKKKPGRWFDARDNRCMMEWN